MKKNILQIIFLSIMVAFGVSCSNEDEIMDVELETPSNGLRTLTVTASITTDDPSTRVALEKQEDKSISLTWEVNDIIHFYFQQAQEVDGITQNVTLRSDATVSSIQQEGKLAIFNLFIPEGLESNLKTVIWGVYGGTVDLTTTDKTISNLPFENNPGERTSLSDAQKEIMIVSSTTLESLTEASSIKANFQHIGNLFSISLKNTGSTTIENIKEIRLNHTAGTTKFGYVYDGTPLQYALQYSGDINENYFESASSAMQSFIYFIPENSSLEPGATIEMWNWQPKLTAGDTYSSPDEIQLEVIDNSDNVIISSDTKVGRDIATGKAFYFYGAIDGTDLKFTDSSFSHEEIEKVEYELDNSLWSNAKFPTDNWRSRQSSLFMENQLWDGVTDASRFETNQYYYFPYHFTIDLGEGQDLEVSKIKIWNWNYWGIYGRTHPKVMEIWATNNPSPAEASERIVLEGQTEPRFLSNDVAWEEWDKIAIYNSVQPDPEVKASDENKAYVLAGEEIIIPEDKIKAYRFIRFRVLETWSMTSSTYTEGEYFRGEVGLTEVKIWGLGNM